jgi:DNA-binding NarL/FixJ family response regulator
VATHPFIEAASPELVARVRAGLLQLSPRDTITLIEMLNGLGNNEIEAKLTLTWNTVKASTAHIFDACKATRNEIIRVCCFDLIDDVEVWQVLRKKVKAYRSNDHVIQRLPERLKRAQEPRPGRRERAAAS